MTKNALEKYPRSYSRMCPCIKLAIIDIEYRKKMCCFNIKNICTCTIPGYT